MAKRDPERAARIRGLRGRATQPSIADAVGVELRTYQNWEAGKGILPEHLVALAAHHDVAPDYIEYGKPAAVLMPDDVPDIAERLKRLEQQQEEALRQQQQILERLSGGGSVLSAEQWALLDRWLAALERAQPPRADENPSEGGERAA